MFRRGLVALLITAGAVTLIAAGLRRAQAPPVGPQPVAWDRENCAECGMMISDRRFAGQLQTRDGRTLDFDDPGCLMVFLSRGQLPVRAIYFRDQSQDRWLDFADAAFVRSADSPMGRGWAAVPRGTPGSISYGQAMKQMEAQINQ